MVVTGSQLIAHMVGDYLLQSDWMATEKRKAAHVALAHALAYTLPFLLLTTNPAALMVIALTHAVIDHFALARYVVFAKNFIGPRRTWPKWERCKGNGYDHDRPVWLSTWLLIIADNILHIAINAAALDWLG